jgi:riboflavin biosynthesis pyrimidine reductase
MVIAPYMNYISKYIQNNTIEFMNQMINRIYPLSKNTASTVNNVYLNPVLSKINKPIKPLYYANFLKSLDGRIATYDKKHECLLTPSSIKNKIDFILFRQLHAQADCLVTNTHYINGLNKGYYGDILSLNGSYLDQWREKNKIQQQKIIILSNSLSFPINKKLERYKERITILTTSKNKKKLNRLKSNGYNVIRYTGKNISGNQLNNYVIKYKFKSIYFIAGPTIVEQMISKNLLDRLYLSTSISMVGTENYDSVIRGNFLKKSIKLELIEMYMYTEIRDKEKEQTLFQVFNLKGK